MKEFKVIPHKSIGPTQLGMTRDEIRAILGTPSYVQKAHIKWGIHWPEKDYFFNNAFQVEYDTDLKAEFIEVSLEPNFTVTFDGIPIHDSPPDQVIASILKYAELDVTDSEYPVSLYFPELNLNLYREHSEMDHFDTIGISTREYGKEVKEKKS